MFLYAILCMSISKIGLNQNWSFASRFFFFFSSFVILPGNIGAKYPWWLVCNHTNKTIPYFIRTLYSRVLHSMNMIPSPFSSFPCSRYINTRSHRVFSIACQLICGFSLYFATNHSEKVNRRQDAFQKNKKYRNKLVRFFGYRSVYCIYRKHKKKMPDRKLPHVYTCDTNRNNINVSISILDKTMCALWIDLHFM